MPFPEIKLGYIIYERSLFDKRCKYFNTRWSNSVSEIVILGIRLALSSMNIRCRLRWGDVAVCMYGSVLKKTIE